MSSRKNIFISYSHDSQEHKDKVRKLAYLLYSHGAEVYFDQFDLKYGIDLPSFMEKGLTEADYILIICSDLYTQKANEGVGGVGYEKSIMTASLMKNINTGHLIPIKMNNMNNRTPVFLASKFYADFDSGDFETNYRLLYQQIWNKTLKEQLHIDRDYIKGIGKNLELLSKEQKSKYQSFGMSEKVIFHYVSNSGIYTIGAGEFEFKTMWTGCGAHSIYAYKDHVAGIGYSPNMTDYPSLSQIFELDYSSRDWRVREGEIFILKNTYDYVAMIKVLAIDNQKEIVEFEYRIIDSLL